MFRNLCFVLVLCLSLVTLAACEKTKPAVAFINAEDVFTKSTAGENAKTFLQNHTTQMQNFLGSLQAKLQENPENEELQKYIQEVQIILQRRLNAEQQNVANTYNAALLRILETYRNTHKLTHIENTQNLLAHDKALDITQQVIELMNKEEVAFVSVTDKEPLPAIPEITTNEKPSAKEQKNKD